MKNQTKQTLLNSPSHYNIPKPNQPKTLSIKTRPNQTGHNHFTCEYLDQINGVDHGEIIMINERNISTETQSYVT